MLKVFGYDSEIDDKTVMIITACRTTKDLKKWAETLSKKDDTFEGYRGMTMMDKLTNPREFDGFKETILIVEHKNKEQLYKFIAQHGVELVPRFKAMDIHNMMLHNDDPDNDVDMDDERTIAEIHGLEGDSDKWDMRTDEEKANKDKFEKEMERMAKKMGLTGPFRAKEKEEGKPKKGISVAVDRMVQDADGSIRVTAQQVGGDHIHPHLAKDYRAANATSTPADYYFAVEVIWGETIAAFAPKKHFDEHGKLFEYRLTPAFRMPPEAAEAMKEGDPGIFTCDGLPEDVKEYLVKMGFIENDEFKAYLNKDAEGIGETGLNPNPTVKENEAKGISPEAQKLFDESGVTASPKDYFFAADVVWGKTVVWLVPKKHWKDKSEILYSEDLDLKEMLELSDNFEARDPASFTYNGTLLEARLAMGGKGLKEGKRFHKYLLGRVDGITIEESLFDSIDIVKGDHDKEEAIVEGASVAEVDAEKSKRAPMSPKDFGDFLSGDGSSTMTGTDSYGKADEERVKDLEEKAKVKKESMRKEIARKRAEREAEEKKDKTSELTMPWDPNFDADDFEGETDEDYEQNVQKVVDATSPSDFLFAHAKDNVGEVPTGIVMFAINPVVYWKAEGCLYDQHLYEFLKKYLDARWDEPMEAYFSFEGTLQDGIDFLRKQGFKEDQAFTDFIQK